MPRRFRYHPCVISVLFLLTVTIFQPYEAWAQTRPDPYVQRQKLLDFAQQQRQLRETNRAEALRRAEALGIPTRRVYDDGRIVELQAYRNGRFYFYTTHNLNAARSIGADRVWSEGDLGLDLSGNGERLGIWDGGAVRVTHREFGTRVQQQDNATSLSRHATHVAGTMVARGRQTDARGMSYGAQLDAYDWGDDSSEMAEAAASGMLVSNHSYGFIHGWTFDYRDDGRWVWLGDLNISETEDAGFGYYDRQARDWDQIAVNAPYYLIVKSAGNDRNDAGPAPGEEHWIYGENGWELSTAPRDPDCGPNGYDCIGSAGNAKNVLTVGAVNDVPNGYDTPSDVVMSSFSAWGPTDDGRIKPDIVANGVGLVSTLSSADDAYGGLSGTSMAAPSAAGAVGLLHEHYRTLNDGGLMRASTVKALLAHTADEAGSAPGPDYAHGWGLANIGRAAEVISADAAQGGVYVQELTLQEGRTIELMVDVDGSQPLRATTAWTDPAGTPAALRLDARTPMLVNDLDIEIIGPDANTYRPWVLDPANPSAAAMTGDNVVDNVEQVLVAAPNAGRYLVRISHKGTLEGGQQVVSLILNNDPVPTHQIAGRVSVDGSDEGVEGVEIRLTGDEVLTTMTTADGSYAFSALNDGAYTVTPSSSSYDVQPNSRAVTIRGDDADEINFTVPAPVARASAAAIQASAASGATATRTLTVTNEGGYDLSYALRLRPDAARAMASKAGAYTAANYTASSDLQRSAVRNTPAPYTASSTPPTAHVTQQTGSLKSSAPYTPTPDNGPASGGSSVFFGVDARAHRVVRLDPSTGTIIEGFNLPQSEAGSYGPQGLAYDGFALYYVNVFGTGAIYQLDPATGDVLQSATIEGLPAVDALAHSGSALYSVSYEAGAIFEVDLAGGTIVRVIEPGVSLGGGVTFGGERGTLFASDFGAAIYEIDPATGEVINTMDAPGQVYGLAYSASEDALFATTNGSSTVHVLDPDDGTTRSTFDRNGLSGLAADEGVAPWVYLDPSDTRVGTMAPGEERAWTLQFNAQRLLGGAYEADLVIITNDPDQPELIIPVTLQVQGGIAGRVTVGEAEQPGVQVVLSGGADQSTETDGEGAYRFFVGPGIYSVTPSFGGAAFDPSTRNVTVGDAASMGQNFVLMSPALAVEPSSLSAVLAPGQAIERTLTIANTGDASTTLAYEFPAFAAREAVERAGVEQNETTHRYAPMDLRKGEADPREGHPVVLGAGGPDAFGYRWIDSNESGGPSFAWQDITTMGTSATLSAEDDGSATVELPFEFPFYGAAKTEVTISTNGYLTFGSDGSAYVNQELPSSGTPDDLIAVFWDDLTTSGGGAIYTYAENDRFIIQWDDVAILGTGTRQTFQAILSASGAVRFQYQRITGTASPTIGIENADASTGLQVAFNTEYAVDNLAVDIVPWPSFIQDVSPVSGEVAGGEQERVTVTLRADEAMAVGDYTDALMLSSNDLTAGSVSVPVALTVQDGVPRIAVQPDALTFPRTLVGASSTGQLTIANEGSGVLTVSSITSDNDDVAAALEAPLDVPAGESRSVEVVFTPSAPGAIAATLTVEHSDANAPSITVPVEGEGQQPAAVAVAPGRLAETLPGGETTIKTLRIENEGGAPLDYHLDLDLVSERPDDLFANADDARAGEATVTHPVIIDDPSSDGTGADVATVRAARVGDQVTFEVIFGEAVTWNALRGHLALDTDRNAETGAPLTGGTEDQDVGAEFEVNLAVGADRVVKLTDTGRGTVTTYPARTDEAILRFSIPLTALGGDDGSMNVAGVVRTGDGERDWFPGAGHGTLTGWMSLSTVAGTVQPGGADEVDVMLDATRLSPGTYKARVLVETNDPAQATVEVPVELTVDGLALAWAANITVADEGGAEQVVTLGQSPGATDAIDPVFGETPLGGGASGFDARFELPDGGASRADIRSDAPASLVSWRLALRPSTANGAITLAWDRTQWPANGALVLSDVDGGDALRVNMRMQSSVTVDGTALGSLLIAYAPSASPRSVPGPPGRIVVVRERGVYDVMGTAVQVDLRDATGEGMVLVQRFDGAPKHQAQTHSIEVDVAGIEEGHVSDYHWLVAYTGSLKPGPESGLRFKLSGFERGVGRPGDVAVYRRTTDTTEPFETVETTVDDQGDPDPTNDDIVVRGTDLSGTYVMASASGFASIQLGAFEAESGSDRIDLTWSTDFEVDNQGFAVQRRLDDTPGFETIGFVQSQGNSTAEQRYQYADASIPYTAGAASYRLVRVDAVDGAEAEFAVLDAAIELPDVLTLHPNFPNPVQAQTTVRYELPEASRVSLTVYNILGQRVATLVDGSQPAGRKELTLDAARLASGSYFLRLVTDGAVRTQRITVVK